MDHGQLRLAYASAYATLIANPLIRQSQQNWLFFRRVRSSGLDSRTSLLPICLLELYILRVPSTLPLHLSAEYPSFVLPSRGLRDKEVGGCSLCLVYLSSPVNNNLTGDEMGVTKLKTWRCCWCLLRGGETRLTWEPQPYNFFNNSSCMGYSDLKNPISFNTEYCTTSTKILFVLTDTRSSWRLLSWVVQNKISFFVFSCSIGG